MLTVAPLAPDAAPLTAGERYALDLLLDLSCVLRAGDGVAGDHLTLRVSSTGGGRGIAALRDHRWCEVTTDLVTIDRAALGLVGDIAGGVAEQRSPARDRYDRVPSAENALVRAGEDLERQPLVSQAARHLGDAVRRAAHQRPAYFLAPWPRGRRWAAALTHDLDVVEWWPAFTALRLAELARKGELRQAASVASAVLASAGRDVVQRGVDQVLAAEAAHGVRSSWFILCGSPTFATARRGDLTYQPEGALARRVLDAIAADGHEIGLHGSFDTTETPALFAAQRARLARLTGAEVAGVRQHYLRMRPEATPAAMHHAGFAFDSTFGFADRNGFRLGVADVLPVWSEALGEALPIDEAPFAWMDRALSKYRGVEQPQLWIDDALALAERCAAVQGLFVAIWHPNLTPALGYPGAPAAYARLVAELVARDAYVAPLGELVAWRRARRAVRATALRPDGSVLLRDAAPEIAIESASGAHVDAHR